MNKEKILTGITNVGEVLVLIGASLWITGWKFTDYIFAAGAVLFVAGRLAEHHDETHNIALKRLYVQRIIGSVMLVLSVLLMFFHSQVNGFVISDYMVHASSTAWLVPFMIFAVIEVYTAFRIPAELKKEIQ
jgi:hypothetical protein